MRVGFSEGKMDPLRATRREQLLLVDDRTQKCRERIREELHAFALQILGYVKVGDLRLLQRPHHVYRPLQVTLDGPRLDLAMVEQRVERLRGHRGDGIGTDDALDVHEVGVVRIFRRGRGPKRSLDCGAFCLEHGEPFAIENLVEILGRELQSGDAGFPEQMLELLAFADSVLEQLVDRRIDAADEDRVDRTNSVDRLSLIGAATKAFDIGKSGFLVHFGREDQGDVNVVAAIDRFFDRGETLFGSRDFDHDVRAIDAFPKLFHHPDRPRGIAREQRRNLEANEAVVSARRGVERGKRIARALNILDCEIPEECVGTLLRADELRELFVVIGAGANRFFEDRRIARHSAQTDFDQTRELAGGEHAAANVVEPNALPGIEQLLYWIFHDRLLTGGELELREGYVRDVIR